MAGSQFGKAGSGRIRGNITDRGIVGAKRHQRHPRPMLPALGERAGEPHHRAADVEIRRGGEERHLAARNADVMQVVGEFLDGVTGTPTSAGSFASGIASGMPCCNISCGAGAPGVRRADCTTERSRADSVPGEEACACPAHSAAAVATSRLAPTVGPASEPAAREPDWRRRADGAAVPALGLAKSSRVRTRPEVSRSVAKVAISTVGSFFG